MKPSKSFFLLPLFFISFFDQAYAVESEAQREAIIAPRAKRFYKSSRARQYLSFGGSYSSDYNSKDYQLNSRYLYQSERFVNEINFEHQSSYADSGSGAAKKYDVKKVELYDLMLSTKARLGSSMNYGVGYHRTIYDKLSTYEYDTRSAIGIGRMFFREKLEADFSVGHRDVKNYGAKFDFIISWRANFKITENITFIQRAFWFLDNESLDNQFKTSLVYRMSDRLSLELRHNFEHRRYEDDNKRVNNNFVNRSVTFGVIFDLN